MQCKYKNISGSGGIRTHASMRLVPKTSALDRSATLPNDNRATILYIYWHSVPDSPVLLKMFPSIYSRHVLQLE